MILEAEEYTAEEIGYIEGLRSARERLEKKLMQKEELQRKVSLGSFFFFEVASYFLAIPSSYQRGKVVWKLNSGSIPLVPQIRAS
jgi:hypothetical protein